jgi:hypothetical protein
VAGQSFAKLSLDKLGMLARVSKPATHLISITFRYPRFLFLRG